MPELPEVEWARRCLVRWTVGRVIRRAGVPASRLIQGSSPERVRRLLTGRAVSGVERKGKHLLVVLDEDRGLHLHLGMTGHLFLRESGAAGGRAGVNHPRLILELDDGKAVVFDDARMFGRIDVGSLDALRSSILEKLGRDAWLEPLSGKDVRAILGRTRRAVKIALLDQTLIAGIGNIHAAEALWRARIHPDSPADALSPEDATRLANGIRWTMHRALGDLAEGGADADVVYLQDSGARNPFLVYGRAGERCSRCKKADIVRTEHGQRATFFCPSCQLSPRTVRAKLPGSGRGGPRVC